MDAKTVIIAVLFASGTVTTILSYPALRNRHTPGARTFMAMMLSLTLYSWGYAMEIYHTELPGMILSLRIEYLGIATLPAFWLILAIQYSGLGRRLTPAVYGVLFFIPAVTLVLHYTNAHHHLFYRELSVNRDAPFPVVSITKGLWYYVHIVYLNLAILAANSLYLRMSLKTWGAYRTQALTMLGGSLLPWAGNVIYQMGLSPYGMDINPIMLTVSGPVFSLAMFRFRMFDLSPIARDSVFESMDDPVLVVDTLNRLVDFNPSARRVVGTLGKNAIGSDVGSILSAYPSLVEQIATCCEERQEGVEVRCDSGGNPRYYQSMISPVRSLRSRLLGRTIILHDVTAQRKLLGRLHEMATTDELTGIANRRHLMDLGAREIDRARRYCRPLSVILMDLDHFKRINDTYGHLAGDDVLKNTAEICRRGLRSCDLLARYGGEEFVILLPETPPSAAVAIAQRLCDAVAASPVSAVHGEVHLTASFGITGVDCVTGIDVFDSLLRKADRALYRAKEGGRNRVELD
ncbi:MAG: diguanylate cyclase [Spirochaetes bacterium]|nr:diguanylate cyclase [Spirochaetota bacterium]